MMKEINPFECLPLDKQEHVALQQLYEGTASPDQQRLILGVIVNKFCRTHDLLIVPGSPEGTGILNGRAFVGMKILKYLKLPVGKFKDEEMR